MHKIQRTYGFSLIELLIVLAITAALSLGAFQIAVDKQDRELAKAAGIQLSQFINGVRSFISRNPTVASGTSNGIDWLRDLSCGGTATANDHYVPCNFSATPGYGFTYSTVINNGGPNNLSATITFPALTINGDARPDLAGAIAQTANGINTTWHAPSSAATFWSVTTDPATAIITATISTNPSNDAWLRTDGSNQMNADLDFNPAAPNRDVNNVQDFNGQRANLSIEANAPIYRDSDDPANFYVDPNADSRISTATVTGGRIDLVNPAGTTIQSTDLLDITAQGGNNIQLNATSGDVIVGGAGGTGVVQLEDAIVRSRGNLRLSELLPKYSHKQTYRVSHNTLIPKPSCPGGTPKVIVQAGQQLIATHNEIGVSNRHLYYIASARDIGASWRAILGTQRFGAFQATGLGLAKTYCYYL